MEILIAFGFVKVRYKNNLGFGGRN